MPNLSSWVFPFKKLFFLFMNNQYSWMQWIYLSVLFFKFIYDLFGHLGLVVLSVDINKVSG